MTHDLEVLLHHDPHPASSPDLEAIHRQGRARRRRSRAAGVGACLALVLVVGAAWALVGRGGGVRATPAVTQEHQVTDLTSYERRVLASVPGAVAVDGTVVLPATAHAGPELSVRSGRARLVGTAIPMGFDGSVGPGYLPTTHTQRAYLRNAPRGSQVVVDPGPLWMGCLAERGSACRPAVLATADDGTRFRLYGIGSERFLERGAPMEMFVDDDYSGRAWHASLIGGIGGTTITRVVVDLVDGTTAQATVNTGRLSAGDTLFWARLPAEPRQVRGYDARGRLVARHTVRACSGGVDCEVR